VWAAGADAVRSALAELAVAEVRDDEPAAHTADRADDPDGWTADVDALLAEFTAEHRPADEIALPAQLSVSQLVELRADPHRLAARLRRPLPFPPKPLARRGTAFHAWLERRFGATRLLDLDQLPGAADTGAMEDTDLARLQDAFLKSRWSLRSPSEVEVPFETTLAGTIVRGRIDAVFREPDGWVVVDWKTGAEPTAAEERSVVVQLAAYRLAWARLESARTGEPEDRILPTVRAAFHYVRSGRTISPADLLGLAELEHLIETAGQD
jgi:DNA helicase-2/ATP-dependent DNA helicase PcrA